MKLDERYFAPYLPFGLRVMNNKQTIFKLATFSNRLGKGVENREMQSVLNEEMKPILRPMTDLQKEEFNYIYNIIRVNIGKTRLKRLIEDGYGLTDLPYFLTEYLFEKHFDFFGLIKKDLAVDINTLN